MIDRLNLPSGIKEVSMTHYLYAIPSFWGGAAHALDLGATLAVYNECLTEAEADYCAIKADWMSVGQDMQIAIEDFAKEHVAPKK
jgi:hypothetical protein